MRKKLIAATLATIALLAAGMILYRGNASTPAPQAAPKPAAVTQVPSEAPAAQTEDEQEVTYTQTLKGLDFLLRVSVNGNDMYRDLEIIMDDGKPVSLLGTLDGQTAKLENITFSPNDNFKLVKLIPGDDREQIVCEGSAWLMRGEGLLSTYTLYRIEGGRLQELISVITERNREEGNGPAAQELNARIEQTTLDGKPAFLYQVKAGAAAERTITFVWNGKRFEDASGEYAKIREEYLP